jgi:hypothetical protein
MHTLTYLCSPEVRYLFIDPDWTDPSKLLIDGIEPSQQGMGAPFVL